MLGGRGGYGTGVGQSRRFEFNHVGTAGPPGVGQTGVAAKTPNHLLVIVEDIHPRLPLSGASGGHGEPRV